MVKRTILIVFPGRKVSQILLILSLILSSCNQKNTQFTPPKADKMMIRIAEIEVDPYYLDKYLAILKEESEASVRMEPGVICIYPMYQTQTPHLIRLLEIYASEEAYKAHIQSPHFEKYKSSTLHMVQSLELIDMKAIDPNSMPAIFEKLSAE